jgi:hypothetical protein
MSATRNPQAGKWKLPAGYEDLGWQDAGREKIVACREAGHVRTRYENGLYMNRGTDTIYTCDICKNAHHVDSSD